MDLYSPAVFGDNPYEQKTPVTGRVVAVLRGITDRRGLQITPLRSRAVPAGVIHELMMTDEEAALESTVNRVALLAFFEVTDGGVILVGDAVRCGEQVLGIVAGFDETHMPNHQNICLRGELTDGATLHLQLNESVIFLQPL